MLDKKKRRGNNMTTGNLHWRFKLTPDVLFSYASSTAMVGWVLLILGPRHWAWFNAIPLWIIPALLSLGYSLIVLSQFSGMGGGFESLEAVAVLMGHDWGLLAGWVHFLAFDLFVGAVMAIRMDRVGVGRVVQAPILGAIFLLGPLGFLIAALTEWGLRSIGLQTPHRLQKESPHVVV